MGNRAYKKKNPTCLTSRIFFGCMNYFFQNLVSHDSHSMRLNGTSSPTSAVKSIFSSLRFRTNWVCSGLSEFMTPEILLREILVSGLLALPLKKIGMFDLIMKLLKCILSIPRTFRPSSMPIRTG